MDDESAGPTARANLGSRLQETLYAASPPERIGSCTGNESERLGSQSKGLEAREER